MEKIKCFKLDNKELFLEKVLVEYNDIPIFYLCTHYKEFYVVLCTDVEEMEYIIVQAELKEVLSMLEGKIQMRQIFTKQEKFWKVDSAEEIDDDVVTYYDSIEKLDNTVLPLEGAYFSILTSEVADYVKELRKRQSIENLSKDSFREIKTDMNSYLFLEKHELLGCVTINKIDVIIEEIIAQKDLKKSDKSKKFDWNKNRIPKKEINHITRFSFHFLKDNSSIDVEGSYYKSAA